MNKILNTFPFHEEFGEKNLDTDLVAKTGVEVLGVEKNNFARQHCVSPLKTTARR